MAGHLLFNSGSNESCLAPQFKWLDNTFKYCRDGNEGIEGSISTGLPLSLSFSSNGSPALPVLSPHYL